MYLRLSIVILSGTNIASSVTGVGTFLSPLFVAIIAGIGAGESIISNSFLFALVKKKKHNYKKRIAHIHEYQSKAYHLYEKIRSDNIITLDEIH